jgi:hypothetical protein
MPIHDWTPVNGGIFHDFHNAWITELRNALYAGGLPGRYYALGEPCVGEIGQEAVDAAFYASRQRTVVIRHTTGDRIVAMIEIVSPANKHGRDPVQDFVRKVAAALREGIHVLVIDPLPPTRHDPAGMHEAIWGTLAAMEYDQPAGLPLTLASYCARETIHCYVEPLAVGSVLIDMPLFLTREHYVNTPLESTYMKAWQGVPQRWRRVIENG